VGKYKSRKKNVNGGWELLMAVKKATEKLRSARNGIEKK